MVTRSHVQTNTTQVHTCMHESSQQIHTRFKLVCVARAGTLQPHKWENAMTIDTKTWGFRRNSNLAAYVTIENLVWQLVSTVRWVRFVWGIYMYIILYSGFECCLVIVEGLLF